jgi:hypothetical protein
VDYGPEGYREHKGEAADGKDYAIDGIEPGDYEIDVQVLMPESYVANCGRITLAPGEEKVHEIQVRPTLLAGRITRGDTGAPLFFREVQVSAHRVRMEGEKVVEHLQRESAMAFTDKDGRYEFKGIAPGHWEIWIAPHATGLNEARRVVEVLEGGQVLAVDFELEPKRVGVLRLRILGDDGKPVTGGLNFVTYEERDGASWSTTLFPRGRTEDAFEFELDAGECRVGAYRTGYRLEPRETVAKIEQGKTIERTCRLIRQGSALLTVLDGTGAPAEGARFRARPMDGGGKARAVYGRSLRNGVFEIWLDPGRFEITASVGEASADPVAVEVKAGESVSKTVRLRD